jgi:cytoskeletal protein CcmA (bactofilin family)
MSNGFNVYFALFAFLVVLAAAAVIILFTTGKNQQQTPVITGQDLTQKQLKHLSQNSVSVGNPDQVLKVGSSAIFSGQVLMQKDLDVAGQLKAGRLKLNNLSVSGTGKFGSLKTGRLDVSGNNNVKGSLNVGKSLNVAGSSQFGGSLSASRIATKSLSLDGDLALTHHIEAGGTTPHHSSGNALGSGGTSSLSGSDTAGIINVNTGGSPHAGCFINVKFASAFHATPAVVVTPVGSAAGSLDFYVKRSSSGFSVCTDNAAPGGRSFSFDYVALD